MKVLKAKDDTMRVGSVVETTNPGNPLCCGSGIYPYAIVISIEPFVMVSEATDMRWSCFDKKQVRVIGRAPLWKVLHCIWRRGTD